MSELTRNHWRRATKEHYQDLVSDLDSRETKVLTTDEEIISDPLVKLGEDRIKKFKKSFGDVAATLQGALREYARYGNKKGSDLSGDINPKRIRENIGKVFQEAINGKVRRGYLENDDIPEVAIDAFIGIYKGMRKVIEYNQKGKV